MHRSRLSVLVIFAAVAACSKRDNSEGTELLSQDRTLIARLEVDQETRKLPMPAACGTITIAAQPAIANQQQAAELTRQALEAEMHGNEQEAGSLLRRASELDATNKLAAYHLGRTSEALGDRTAAVKAYCRYLALTPTVAESIEARQRVEKLSKAEVRVAAGSVSDSVSTGRRVSAAPARRVTRERSTVAPQVVASARVERSVPATSPKRSTSAAGTVESAPQPPRASEPVTSSPTVDSSASSTETGSEVVATSRPEPPVEQPSTASDTERRGPSRAQGAIVGAATGAIIGAATGRSVKGAVIGAAAGGILGTMVGRGGMRPPVGRGIRS